LARDIKTKQVTTKQVRTNATSGSYRPFFFDAEEYKSIIVLIMS